MLKLILILIRNSISILGKKGSYKIENADWGGQVGRNYYLWAGVNCASWAVIYPGRDQENVKEFVNSLSNLAGSMGLMFQGPPLREEVSSPRTPDYKKGKVHIF